MSLDVEEVLNRIRRLDELYAIYGSINRWLDATATNQMLKTSEGKLISEEEIHSVMSDFEKKMRAIQNTRKLLFKSSVSIKGPEHGNVG